MRKATSNNFGMVSTWRKKKKKKKKRKTSNSWKQEITTGMREKGINSMEWIQRDERRRKIKLKFWYREM